ncbi:hypothetical protein [Campylobacter troglodytis]|uniref:hypothetical protein n=1 Tax=Campylobacter troglodytis TaxID=654363 RepID=UPI0011596266|nr:hypothetical protein [Campylobacter troglodytis]TQR57743.1 hypothetical protein DMC01_08325 [Campylobacter troglodytis]
MLWGQKIPNFAFKEEDLEQLDFQIELKENELFLHLVKDLELECLHIAGLNEKELSRIKIFYENVSASEDLNLDKEPNSNEGLNLKQDGEKLKENETLNSKQEDQKLKSNKDLNSSLSNKEALNSSPYEKGTVSSIDTKFSNSTYRAQKLDSEFIPFATEIGELNEKKLILFHSKFKTKLLRLDLSELKENEQFKDLVASILQEKDASNIAFDKKNADAKDFDEAILNKRSSDNSTFISSSVSSYDQNYKANSNPWAKDKVNLNSYSKANPHIKLFKRRHHILMATRFDGFGARFCNLLNAMYIARASGLKFGLVWDERKPADLSKDVYVPPIEKVFSKQFLAKHSYTEVAHSSYELPVVRTLKELSEGSKRDKNWGFVWSDGHIFDEENTKKHLIHDLNYEEYRSSFVKSFKELDFSEDYKEVMAHANAKTKELGGFLAFHVRNGDAVKSDNWRKTMFPGVIMRVFPLEILLHLVEANIKEHNCVMFGGDAEALGMIKDKVSGFKDKLFVSAELCPSSFSRDQKEFFDFYLMSLASKIISPELSAFSLIPSLVGEVEKKSFLELLSPAENTELIEKNLKILPTDHLYKASSIAYLYKLALMMNKTYEEKKQILLRAYEYDPANPSYANTLLKEALALKDLSELEACVKFFVSRKLDLFIEGLVHPSYKDIPAKLKELEFKAAPYLNFTLASLYEREKNAQKTLSLYSQALAGDPTNALFASYLTNYLLRQNEALNSQFKNLQRQNEAFEPSATQRTKNSLAYKLGKLIITHSKSLFGYMTVPFVLASSYLKHKRQKRLLEDLASLYPRFKLSEFKKLKDYKEAKELKNHLSYKLGSALIECFKGNPLATPFKLFHFSFFKARKIAKKHKKSYAP